MRLFWRAAKSGAAMPGASGCHTVSMPMGSRVNALALPRPGEPAKGSLVKTVLVWQVAPQVCSQFARGRQVRL